MTLLTLLLVAQSAIKAITEVLAGFYAISTLGILSIAIVTAVLVVASIVLTALQAY